MAAIAVLWGGVWVAGFSTAHAADWWEASDPPTGAKVRVNVERLVCRRGLCTIDEEAEPFGGRSPRRGPERVDYDCTGLRVRDAAGGGWRPVASNSLSEALLTFACTFQQRREGAAADKVLNADGRSFRPVALGALAAKEPGRPPAAVGAMPSIASGAAVQVAAEPSEGEASDALQRLRARQAELMSGLSTQVAPAEVEGRRVYRALVVGFADLNAARRFCMALKARKAACFIRSNV